MNARLASRHHRLSEQIIANPWFAGILGALFCVVLPASLLWGTVALTHLNPGQFAAIVTALLGYAAAYGLTHTLLRYPGSGTAARGAPRGLGGLGGLVRGTLRLRVDLSRLLMCGCCRADCAAGAGGIWWTGAGHAAAAHGFVAAVDVRQLRPHHALVLCRFHI